MAGAFDWVNFGGLDYCDECIADTGGFRDGLVALKSELDLDNWTTDAAGNITAIPLIGAATWRRFRPVKNENTTITYNGVRDSVNSSLKYPILIQGQFYKIDNVTARDVDRISNGCDLVFLIRRQDCSIMVLGLERLTCGGVESFECILEGLKLTSDNVDFGNKDTSVSNIIGFGGISKCRELYVDPAITWASQLALSTATCV